MEVDFVDVMGDDLTVVNAARVSFNKWKYTFTDKDERLIRYLAEHGHWTPFGHPQMSFKIKAPIFVRSQLFKHKIGLTENEISRRYVNEKPEFYMPDVWRERAESKKQGSKNEPVSEPLYDNWDHTTTHDAVLKHYKSSLTLYENLLENNTCPEQARMVLPQAMYTSWIWTGSLYAFSRVCNLRIHEDAQLETREIAAKIYDNLQKAFPVSCKYLIKTT